MKKSIKYAGVAAATLLAVAPVAAPVFGGQDVAPTTANTAKATYSKATQEDAYNAFDATFKDYNNATQADFLESAAAVGILPQMRFTYTANMLNGIVKPLHPQYQSILNDLDVAGQLNEISFVVLPGNGESMSEWRQEIEGAAEHGGSVSYRIVGLPLQTVKDHALWSNQKLVEYAEANDNIVELAGHKLDKTVTASTEYAQQEVHALNINFDTPVDGYVGESKTDFNSNGKYPLTITDNKGNKVTPQNVTSNYFNGLDLATVINGTELPKAGTVVQKMTIKFSRSEYNELFADLDQVTINGTSYSGGLLSKVLDKASNSINVSRTINVTLDNFSDEEINGEVTTPIEDLSNDTIVTHLYDGKGNQITQRALAQGTDWFTDTKRTNNNTGEVFYRVSTNEWVKASDVTYNDKSTDTDGGDTDTDETTGLTNITELPAGSTVALDGPAGFVYSLFTSDGTAATRGLAGATSWATDKQATDAAGNTYYRVSTNEWVKAGSGVTLN